MICHIYKHYKIKSNLETSNRDILRLMNNIIEISFRDSFRDEIKFVSEFFFIKDRIKDEIFPYLNLFEGFFRTQR